MATNRKRGKLQNGRRNNRGSSGAGGRGGLSSADTVRKSGTTPDGGGVGAIFRSLRNNSGRSSVPNLDSLDLLHSAGSSWVDGNTDFASHAASGLAEGDASSIKQPHVPQPAPQSSKEEDGVVTKNDVNGLVSAFTEAVRDQRAGFWRNPRYYSPKFAPILNEIRSRLQTVSSVILPPIIKSQLGAILEPMRVQFEEVGDTYFKQAMDDIEYGRVDRFEPLMWMAGINLIRLRLAKHELFADVNAYIKKTYMSDPADPNSHTFFMPAEVEVNMKDTWEQINRLIEAGIILIRETIQFKVANSPHELIVMTMADKPLS